MTQSVDTPSIRAVSARTTDGLDLHGQRGSAPASTSLALLLHDRGGDLDSLVWLRADLSNAGFEVASLDLPGHGITEGDYNRDCVSAIGCFARSLDPDGSRGLVVVAVGETCAQLLATAVDNPVGAVLVDPVLGATPGGESRVLESWSSVPTLVIVGSTNPQVEADAAELALRARSWLVRAYVPRAADGPDSLWRTHVGSMASRFGLEQATYWQTRHRSAGSPPNTDTRPRHRAIFRKHS